MAPPLGGAMLKNSMKTTSISFQLGFVAIYVAVLGLIAFKTGHESGNQLRMIFGASSILALLVLGKVWMRVRSHDYG